MEKSELIIALEGLLSYLDTMPLDTPGIRKHAYAVDVAIKVIGDFSEIILQQNKEKKDGRRKIEELAREVEILRNEKKSIAKQLRELEWRAKSIGNDEAKTIRPEELDAIAKFIRSRNAQIVANSVSVYQENARLRRMVDDMTKARKELTPAEYVNGNQEWHGDRAMMAQGEDLGASRKGKIHIGNGCYRRTRGHPGPS